MIDIERRRSMIRLAAIPPTDINPYIELFNRALADYDTESVQGFRFCRADISRRGRDIDFLHIHWYPERFWRLRVPSIRFLHLLRFWYLLRLARARGMKIVWTVHDVGFKEGIDRWDLMGYQLLASHSDLLLFHDEAAREEASRRFACRMDRTMLVRHGNLRGFYPAPRARESTLRAQGLAQDRRTLLCFGLLRRYKGFDIAIQAMDKLDDRYQILVAGKSFSPEFASELEIAGRARERVRVVRKLLEEQELADFIHAADCVLFPYRTVTCSGAAMTALSMDRGIVAADLPYFQGLLQHEPRAGVLTPPTDPAALARGIDEYFSIPVEDRHDAARRLSHRFEWTDLVRPFAEWLTQNARPRG